MFPAVSTPEKFSLSGLSRGDLEALAERLLAENAALKQAVADLRAEVAALKGVRGRPVIRPSGMEQKTAPKPAGGGKRGKKRRKTERLAIHEDRIIHASVPVGSRFKSLPPRRRGATKTSSSRISCCARMRCASAGNGG